MLHWEFLARQEGDCSATVSLLKTYVGTNEERTTDDLGILVFVTMPGGVG